MEKILDDKTREALKVFAAGLKSQMDAIQKSMEPLIKQFEATQILLGERMAEISKVVVENSTQYANSAAELGEQVRKSAYIEFVNLPDVYDPKWTQSQKVFFVCREELFTSTNRSILKRLNELEPDIFKNTKTPLGTVQAKTSALCSAGVLKSTVIEQVHHYEIAI
jgi:hypothetical protein